MSLKNHRLLKAASNLWAYKTLFGQRPFAPDKTLVLLGFNLTCWREDFETDERQERILKVLFFLTFRILIFRDVVVRFQ